MSEPQEPAEDISSPENELTKSLMNELVRIRKRKKIGQEPLAKAIGISQGRLSQIENLKGGSMSLETFILYAQTMGAEIVLVPEKSKKGNP